jgi:hypothetical protein
MGMIFYFLGLQEYNAFVYIRTKENVAVGIIPAVA